MSFNSTEDFGASDAPLNLADFYSSLFVFSYQTLVLLLVEILIEYFNVHNPQQRSLFLKKLLYIMPFLSLIFP